MDMHTHTHTHTPVLLSVWGHWLTPCFPRPLNILAFFYGHTHTHTYSCPSIFVRTRSNVLDNEHLLTMFNQISFGEKLNEILTNLKFNKFIYVLLLMFTTWNRRYTISHWCKKKCAVVYLLCILQFWMLIWWKESGGHKYLFIFFFMLSIMWMYYSVFNNI